MKKIKGGFTLIELLVVIAIIGLLASIVLVSLNSARSKAKDARVVSDVQQVRVAIESGFNGVGYPDLSYVAANCDIAAGVTSNKGTNANCTNASGPKSAVLNQLVSDSVAQTGNMFFHVGTGNTAYVVFGRLVSNPSLYFCIDSTGKTNQQDNGATTAGTITCN